MTETFLRLPQVKARTGLSRSTIYKRMGDKAFPRQVKLGGRAVGWLETEIEDWIIARIEDARPRAAPVPAFVTPPFEVVYDDE